MSHSDSERVLSAVVGQDGNIVNCEVRTSVSAGHCVVEVEMPDGTRFTAGSAVDFEAALLELRVDLDHAGILLLCNRFRRNAFVSSLARQMSNGLGCYLVALGESVDPEAIVDSLAGSSHLNVVHESVNKAFVAEWIVSFNPDG